MTQSVERHAEQTGLRESFTKPAPRQERLETPLFQTMDELRLRHGNQGVAKDRLYLWGGGFLIGSVLFGVLYLVIMFLE